MKQPFFKKLTAGLMICFSVLGTALIIHSCKKDNSATKPPTVTAPVISEAKAWYESTYPVAATAGTKLTTQGLNSTANGIFDYSQHIKPDWAHGASYTRYNTGVVELPIDPSSPKISSDFKNMTTGKVLYKQQYSRSSFLLLNDGKNYKAYVMTIITDSAYINNDLSKLSLTTYRKRDPNFSGVVVYFTPTGKFVSSYGYKNGTLIPGPSANTASTGQNTNSINTSHLKTDEIAISDCLAWFLDTYDINGDLISSVYLYTTCPPDPGEPGTGGGTSPAAPTPCTPAASTTPPPDDAAHFTSDVAQPTPTPVGGDGDGGLPPPVPDPQPCPTTAMVADTVIDPCAQLPAVISRSANAIIAAQNRTILANTISSGIEYGTDQNVTSLTGNTYVNTAVTPGTTAGWTPGFTWNSTNGYTTGYSHGHPGGTGPSPADVFSLVRNLTNPALTGAGKPSLQFYENNAQVTT